MAAPMKSRNVEFGPPIQGKLQTAPVLGVLQKGKECVKPKPWLKPFWAFVGFLTDWILVPQPAKP